MRPALSCPARSLPVPFPPLGHPQHYPRGRGAPPCPPPPSPKFADGPGDAGEIKGIGSGAQPHCATLRPAQPHLPAGQPPQGHPPPPGKQTLGTTHFRGAERSAGMQRPQGAGGRRVVSGLRQLQRAEGTARFLLLLPLPNDFHFTCRQPRCGGAGGSAALRGTAVTAAAPSPPRGGSRAGGAGRAAPRSPVRRPLVPPGDRVSPALGVPAATEGEGRGGSKDL